MKFFRAVIFIISISALSIYSQSVNGTIINKETVKKSYPVPGSELLRKQDEEVSKYFAEHPGLYDKMKMMKKAAWGFTVGSQKSWYAQDLTNSSFYTVPSTCRAVGAHCYIFVADDMWGTNVDQAAVDSVVNEFENKTPADPNKGVYQTDVDTFGDPPDVDNDPRIIILILNIKDGYSGSGGYVAGYFSSYNESDQATSNKAEMYYMDADPTDLKTSGGLETALETAAHEFQHMINWNYHKFNPEITFINEGLSMFAEINCGYPASGQYLYAAEPDFYLLGWRGNDNTKVLNDYARAQRFFIYINDQFGTGIFKYFVQNYLTGIAGLNNALKNFGQSITFTQLFINWEIANKINDRSLGQQYGYKYPDLPASEGKVFYDPNVTETDTVQRLAAEYFTFTGGSNLSINFSTGIGSVLARAIEIGSDGSVRMVNVPLNTDFSVPDYGSVYKTIHFAVIDTSQSADRIYSFKATGTAPAYTEMKWDTSEPTGYYLLTPSDTVCVAFDAFPGGVLDSVRVALRRTGSITGGVWRSTGVIQPTPLGKKLTGSITASVNETPEYPYPVPYNNWAGIDLRSYRISTDQPFAVGFVIGSDPKTPGVMATDYPGQNPYHSYTYLHDPGSGSQPNWYYLTSSDTTVALYLIRAYVSFKGQVIETTPSDYTLSQNYPNPFNSTTKIDLALPKAGHVNITLYDQLGRRVAVITDKEYEEGEYTLYYNAAELASGIYFYKINTPGFVETKKMVVLK